MTSYKIFGALLFLSAFLLFSIQPLVTRIILPSLGGSPSVWTTSMLFFQFLLLAGYIWAHLVTKYLPLWIPPILQILLALLAFYFIDFQFTLRPDFENATMWQLSILFKAIGLPYFLLAMNAPFYQSVYKYFNTKDDDRTPYALYSLSNIGSFAALISYPFIIEPMFDIQAQAHIWTLLYSILCVLIAFTGIFSAFNLRNIHVSTKTAKFKHSPKTSDELNVKPKIILSWCLLAFLPSTLMLSVTNYVTTDIASVPLLWLIPLSFYILSFVIAFAEPEFKFTKDLNKLKNIVFILSAISIGLIAINLPYFIWAQIIIHYIAFLSIAIYSHLLLNKRKPHENNLTYFYIIVSVGGFLGGAFSTFFVPNIFLIPIEYHFTILASLLTFALFNRDGPDTKERNYWLLLIPLFLAITVYFTSILMKLSVVIIALYAACLFVKNKQVFFSILSGLIIISVLTTVYGQGNMTTVLRNHFGTLYIIDNQKAQSRILKHGTTLHGLQFQTDELRYEPNTYYSKQGPLGDIFEHYDHINTNQNIAVLGLGTGTLACYTKDNRTYDFYEINEDVIKIATDPVLFDYLNQCQPNSEIILGDARIKIAEKSNNLYDMIILDTFSSDSIPIHLLTLEAVNIYLSKLKNDGVLVMHISNRHFNLAPILAKIAQKTDRDFLLKNDLFKRDETYEPNGIRFESSYAIITNNQDTLNKLKSDNWEAMDKSRLSVGLWTDSHSNIFEAIKR
jgi:spermidine synthase